MNRISAVNVANRDIIPISSDSPLLSSAKSGWDGIQVEQHCLPPAECPELELQHHSITIILGGRFEIDWRLAGGREQRTQMKRGDICITPSGVPTQARWHDSANFLLLSISPTLIERAVYESIDTSLIEIAPKRGVLDPQILHIGSALKAELESGCESGFLYGESLGLALAVHLLRRYSTQLTISQLVERSPNQRRRYISVNHLIVDSLPGKLVPMKKSHWDRLLNQIPDKSNF